MEEVSAHVHPGPIVPDVLTRQHEYRSGLIWSGDHETCFTDLQCRRLGPRYPTDIPSTTVVSPSPGARTGLGARGVKRGARRQPSGGAGGGRPPVPPFPGRTRQVDPGRIEVERSEGSGQVESGEGSGGGHFPVDPFDSQNLDIPSFSLDLMQPSQSLPIGLGTLITSRYISFRAPPPPGTVGSFDDEKREDDTDDVQRLGFGHCVGKKTARFTPSEWP
ncbi:hypothetical protein M9H77_04778 [Catharanthus roseus]|uniref:Uncharacterized protein n=1 Tax=Catharanthus roseus TaxID=4058 RepID=A0ACC0CF81_CATRO|nr:hypothetical protein M9H77_04778 [Catharanthus roseus]